MQFGPLGKGDELGATAQIAAHTRRHGRLCKPARPKESSFFALLQRIYSTLFFPLLSAYTQ